ncbi:TlpA disulfide reductase family protein [Geobacter sp. DSM 9736]|uniref:TlpA disulfide reductase family protein n=1 Tax=Geobacter sp. DSM 9736 TaxID=1277350 RepID=UPI000B50F33D|nr:TlpA disulfide reductase family protein [Geobacter sp. DSM 9736]SNB44736.1 Thiol-disulfide isomerase or thioredoxin [Geobacter sp. DSM 9736]
MKKWTCLLVALTLAVLAACSKKEAPPAEGKPAPGFALKDLAGGETSLEGLRGKVVLLNFWATWCPPCREEIPSMMKLNQAMAGKPFQMVAVSIDEGGKEAVQRYFQSSGTSLPTLLDTEQKVGRRYGITGVPETFVIDRKGVIMKKVIGPMDWSQPEVVKYLEELMKQ